MRTAAAIEILVQRGDTLCFSAQNVREFWNVSTRPVSETRGFGLTLDDAFDQVLTIEHNMQLMPDNEQTYRTWRALIAKHRVRGVQVHDTYLAATLITNHVTHLLTWNVKDFKRFDAITALTPDEVLAGAL